MDYDKEWLEGLKPGEFHRFDLHMTIEASRIPIYVGLVVTAVLRETGVNCVVGKSFGGEVWIEGQALPDGIRKLTWAYGGNNVVRSITSHMTSEAV